MTSLKVPEASLKSRMYLKDLLMADPSYPKWIDLMPNAARLTTRTLLGLTISFHLTSSGIRLSSCIRQSANLPHAWHVSSNKTQACRTGHKNPDPDDAPADT